MKYMSTSSPERASTGVPGLDRVLGSGLLPERASVLRGGPGMGKTILGEHSLPGGDGTSLCVSLEESGSNLRANAERRDPRVIDGIAGYRTSSSPSPGPPSGSATRCVRSGGACPAARS